MNEPGRAQRVLADQEARSEADADTELVGFGLLGAADLEARIAYCDDVADLEIEPREQCRVGSGAEHAAALV